MIEYTPIHKMIVEEKYIPARVGMMSLIGVGDHRPCSWGNYFSFAKTGDMWGLRCLNMWAENLNEARGRFLLDGLVKVRIYTEAKGENSEGQWCIVIDERIHKDWRYDKCCYTGTWRPGIDVARDIYETLGDPDNELEYWTDNEMYHAKRCEAPIVRDGKPTGVITCHYPRTKEKADELIAVVLEKRKAS